VLEHLDLMLLELVLAAQQLELVGQLELEVVH
jgi:hypothetical protein